MAYKNIKLDSKALFRGNKKTKQVGVYGSKKFPGPQNSGPGSVGQRNVFDLTQHILNVITTTVTADTDWTRNGSTIYNTTDDVGIGTSTPTTLLETEFISSGGLSGGFDVGNFPDLTLLGAPAGFAAPGVSSYVKLADETVFLYSFIGSVDPGTLTPYVEDLYSDTVNGITIFNRMETTGYRTSYANTGIPATHTFDVGSNGVRVSAAGGSYTNNIEADTGRVYLATSEQATGDTANIQLDVSTGGGVTLEAQQIATGDSYLLELSPLTGGMSVNVSSTAGGVAAVFTISADGVGGGPGIQTTNLLPAYDDDAAAGVGGLLTGELYQTTGLGAAPLNEAGILMVKQ